MKNQPPPVPVANSNRAEVIPVSRKDSADSKTTEHATSTQINPFRKVKGMGAPEIYSVTNITSMHGTGLRCACIENVFSIAVSLVSGRLGMRDFTPTFLF